MIISAPTENYYIIALLEIPSIGSAIAKKLIEQFGSAKQIFSLSLEKLKALDNIGRNIIEAIEKEHIFQTAQEQINFSEANNIEILSYFDTKYPQRLKHCSDAPLIIYFKGSCDLNNPKIVGIVGTRNATSYGKLMCKNVIEELAEQNVLIISGLAYGIDVNAHQEALNYNTPTLGVLAHGLDTIYPKGHSSIAQKMTIQGGLITEHKKTTKPNRENFPKRNRIVAGMCDAIVVIESAITGGSMITAKLGNDYSRDVFSIPGRLGDKYSEGCNHLIKTNQAHLLQASKDISYILGWDNSKKPSRTVQKQLFVELNNEEQNLIDVVMEHKKPSIDDIANSLQLPISQVSTQLLMLEFKGLIKQLPGKIYELV